MVLLIHNWAHIGWFMSDMCPQIGKALGNVALGFFQLLGMDTGINHPMMDSVVKLKAFTLDETAKASSGNFASQITPSPSTSTSNAIHLTILARHGRIIVKYIFLGFTMTCI